VGLLKLWNKREEILGKVTQAASTVVATARGAEAKEQAAGLAQGGGRAGGGAQAAQRVKNPLRFLGRDEWLALVPLQVFFFLCSASPTQIFSSMRTHIL
jgi:hypothetical protein